MSLLDTTQLAIESAMSGSLMRQNLLTNDLANADTPNFQPSDVDFGQTLANALSSGQSPSATTYTPVTQAQVAGPDGNGVSTDQTETDISENALLYEELTQVAAAREGILKTAMNSTGS